MKSRQVVRRRRRKRKKKMRKEEEKEEEQGRKVSAHFKNIAFNGKYEKHVSTSKPTEKLDR